MYTIKRTVNGRSQFFNGFSTVGDRYWSDEFHKADCYPREKADLAFDVLSKLEDDIEMIRVFAFWKQSRLDGKFVLMTDDIKVLYSKYIETKGVDWVSYYSTSNAVMDFITAKEGLNSAPPDDFEDLVRELKPMTIEFINTKTSNK